MTQKQYKEYQRLQKIWEDKEQSFPVRMLALYKQYHPNDYHVSFVLSINKLLKERGLK